MKALASYFYNYIERSYKEWQNSHGNQGVPGRLVLKEFDSELVSEICSLIERSSVFNLSPPGSSTGFILAVEDHEHYINIQRKKFTFAELAKERNREGSFFCLMFVAEVKPTLEQVTGIDQSSVFELTELVQWVSLAKNNDVAFTDEFVDGLARFIAELTNSSWANRPFINLININRFIEGVIESTAKNGLFYEALGKNCTHLGGINRLDTFNPLKDAGAKYRQLFRSLITKTLLKDIGFWRAVNKNKEVDLEDIIENIKTLSNTDSNASEFCQLVRRYFESYFNEENNTAELLKRQLMDNFDCTFPYSSILQKKNTKPKFLLGKETINHFTDHDEPISEEDRMLLNALDEPKIKMDINDLRQFYFTHKKLISKSLKLDKAWSKAITTSKTIECNDLIEGLMSILSKSILLNDLEGNKVVFELAKDRTRKSLERKNWHALKYFNNEYNDLELFWSQFGGNFELDFGLVFSPSFAETLSPKSRKYSDAKGSNQFHFRVVVKSEHDASVISSWDLTWIFNPHSIESAKFVDFGKVLKREGYFYKHKLSMDPLHIKKTESKPTIENINVFAGITTKAKKGSIYKSDQRASTVFHQSLENLYEHNYISNAIYEGVLLKYNRFEESWKQSLEIVTSQPLTSDLSQLQKDMSDLFEFMYDNINSSQNKGLLINEILSAHTLTVNESPDYIVYLPWSPFSLLVQSNRNTILKNVAESYNNENLKVGNKSEGVLSKLFQELLSSIGKGSYLNRYENNRAVDLVCTNMRSGYFEYSKLSGSKSALSDIEIKSVIKPTALKFLETYPNERHHLQVLCKGLDSFEHLLAVYRELLKASEVYEEELAITLIFCCDSRSILDSVYQTICESFDNSIVTSQIVIRVISSLSEVSDGEVDIIFNFDPLFAHNVLSHDTPYVEVKNKKFNWECTTTRKVPTDPLSKKTLFSLNNHTLDSTGFMFHKAFMIANNMDCERSLCREVKQSGLAQEITEGLGKCNWLVIYDYLLNKDTLSNSCYVESSSNNKRVLRYIQGEGNKRSLAIVTDKESLHITKNLNQHIRKWNLIHTDKVPELVNEIFKLSNSFSSDCLLRSVGTGNFAHDLVGTAGVATLLNSIFKKASSDFPIIWIHLDDYMSWFKSSVQDDAFKSLGQNVNYISDLLGIYLTPEKDGSIKLSIIVCESKLSNGGDSHTIKSCKQIKSTVDLISSMLSSADNLDFDYWKNKFFEFIIGNLEFKANVFEFKDLLSLNNKQLKIDVYGVSVLLHYGNSNIKTETQNVYEESHLYQMKVSEQDTSFIFENMMLEGRKANIFEGLTLKPLLLNRLDNAEVNEEVVNTVNGKESTERLDTSRLGLNREPEVTAETDRSDTSNVLNNSVTEVVETVRSDDFFDDEPFEISQQAEDLRSDVSNECEAHCEVYSATKVDNHSDAGKISNDSTASLDKSHVFNLVNKSLGFLESNVAESTPEVVDIESIKLNIRKIFGHENLPSEFADEYVTPNSIVIKLFGDVKLNASKIEKLRDNFLSVVGLSLRRVYPNPGVMVLVFNRQNRQTVYFSELLRKTLEVRKNNLIENYNSNVVIGLNEFSNECVYFKLDGASPHALIGGQTKSGKSILMNNMIIDLMVTNSPDNLRLRLFDPKQVEFTAYEKSAHLAHPVIVDKYEATERLIELEELMNERYSYLRSKGLKDFETHNRKFPDDKLPREVVFFDELADWILDTDFKDNTKDVIVRLSSKGRAAGIHLVLATQRPSADVVFPLLRANLDTKIALKVDRDQNSEIILGESGAEKLLGYGHGIVKAEGETHTIQVGFTPSEVFDDLVEIVLDYWNTYKVISNK